MKRDEWKENGETREWFILLVGLWMLHLPLLKEGGGDDKEQRMKERKIEVEEKKKNGE